MAVVLLPKVPILLTFLSNSLSHSLSFSGSVDHIHGGCAHMCLCLSFQFATKRHLTFSNSYPSNGNMASYWPEVSSHWCLSLYDDIWSSVCGDIDFRLTGTILEHLWCWWSVRWWYQWWHLSWWCVFWNFVCRCFTCFSLLPNVFDGFFLVSATAFLSWTR